MPTFEARPTFWRDFDSLSAREQQAFMVAVRKLISDLRRDTIRLGLRIRHVQGTRNIYEMTWAPDGRATFEYEDERRPGEPHIVWRRVGTHDVFRQP